MTGSALLLGGCDSNLSVYGVYFPAWMVCLAGGFMLAVGVTHLMGPRFFGTALELRSWARLALTVIFGAALWWLLFRG